MQTASYLLELERSPAAVGERFSFCPASISDPFFLSLAASSLSALASLFNRLAARMVPFLDLTCFTIECNDSTFHKLVLSADWKYLKGSFSSIFQGFPCNGTGRHTGILSEATLPLSTFGFSFNVRLGHRRVHQHSRGNPPPRHPCENP